MHYLSALDDAQFEREVGSYFRTGEKYVLSVDENGKLLFEDYDEFKEYLDFFMPEETNKEIVHYVQNSVPSDTIRMNLSIAAELEKLFHMFSNSKYDGLVPSDLVFAGTIPLLDVALIIDDTSLLSPVCRIKIQENYHNILAEAPDKGDNGEPVLVYAGILELTTFSSGLFKGNNTSLIFPLFVQKGYDYFVIGMMNQIGLCPNYSEDFKTAIYSPRLKEYINTFDERAGATLMRAWYGIQVALLHPVVKDIFSNPVTSYKHNDVEAKIYHHKARYIRKHIINSEDIEKALKIGEQKQQTRHTLIWYVIGHWRHYKDGRTLFVKPYWKGPLRKTKTTTTTRDREIVFQTMQKEKVDE